MTSDITDHVRQHVCHLHVRRRPHAAGVSGGRRGSCVPAHERAALAAAPERCARMLMILAASLPDSLFYDEHQPNYKGRMTASRGTGRVGRSAARTRGAQSVA